MSANWVWENGIATQVGSANTGAYDINDDQIIVGLVPTPGGQTDPGFWRKIINVRNSFNWESFKIDDMGRGTMPTGICNSNVISGYITQVSNSVGILWGNPLQLPYIIKQQVTDNCSPIINNGMQFLKINASGYVCGVCIYASGFGRWKMYPSYWSERSKAKSINYSINSSPSRTNDFFDLGKGIVYNINSTGKIVGDFITETRLDVTEITEAFLWGPSVERTFMLGRLPSVDGASTALGINNLGQVVGNSSTQDALRLHAFLWQQDTVPPMVDLNEKLTPELRQNWELIDAVDINDAGQIVGVGKFGTSTVGYVLTLGN